MLYDNGCCYHHGDNYCNENGNYGPLENDNISDYYVLLIVVKVVMRALLMIMMTISTMIVTIHTVTEILMLISKLDENTSGETYSDDEDDSDRNDNVSKR